MDKEIKKQWFSSVDNGRAFPRIYKSGYEVHNTETWRLVERT
ncbi:hypothetical protein [Wolbachia endosymbiont of Diaphorina citri]|nr:hypothetical protein [Wolbachia endosymbiont of Diaphorina citri]